MSHLEDCCRKQEIARVFAVRLAWITTAIAMALSLVGQIKAQETTTPAPSPPSTSVPTELEPLPSTNLELLQEVRRLRSEVEQGRQAREADRQLREEVRQLRDEVDALRGGRPWTTPTSRELGYTGSTTDSPGGRLRGLPNIYQSGAAGPETPEKPDADRYPLKGEYKYNHNATGPLGGGGYFSLTTHDDEFTLGFTNQTTLDGTFYDRQNMPTSEQGFNVPFARTYLYGNITKDFSYQIGTQGFLGTYNLLDLWMSWHINERLTIRAGKGLTPPVYEYYAFSPALEPVIANSPMFQVAGKRPIGLMFSGMLLNRRVQWWSGMSNSGTSLYGNLDRNIDYNGAFDVTPFRGDRWAGTILEGLGGGFGLSSGHQQYLLNQPGIAFTNNGEATTNPVFVTPVGVPFYVYNSDVSALGNRTRLAPHFYWFGRFSLLAEYMNFSRRLTDGTNIGQSTQTSYYVNASYWLTGERDFVGNGFQGYSTIEPLRPFYPPRGLWGPGAWQVAAQWSEFNAGSADIARGFVDSAISATRNRNVQVGLNWWPNKYTRFSLDYVWTNFNRGIPITGPTPISQYNTVWFRMAMFF